MIDGSYVVTGGNTGIGKAIALALAKKEAHVVIVSRDPRKGAGALAEIQKKTGQEAVDLVAGDLGTIGSTHRLADDLLERFPHISVLINNAGIWEA